MRSRVILVPRRDEDESVSVSVQTVIDGLVF
jgi:hypothetical protein